MNLCISWLEVIIASENHECKGERNDEDNEGGDDEADDAGILNAGVVVTKTDGVAGVTAFVVEETRTIVIT